MPIHMEKLIKSEDVPALLDRAMSAIAALRATYTADRSDLSGSNEKGDVAYLNLAHDIALITRQMQHDCLDAAAKRIGDPVETFDIPCVLEMEGVDVDILKELRGIHSEQSSVDNYDIPPSNTDHLVVHGGRLV